MPLTPTDTPSDKAAKQEARVNRFSEEYDGSMEETIKPKRNNNARNLSRETGRIFEFDENDETKRVDYSARAEEIKRLFAWMWD